MLKKEETIAELVKVARKEKNFSKKTSLFSWS